MAWNNETAGTKKDPAGAGGVIGMNSGVIGMNKRHGGRGVCSGRQVAERQSVPKENPAEAGLGARGASLRPKGL